MLHRAHARPMRTVPLATAIALLCTMYCALFASVASAQTPGITASIDGFSSDEWPNAQAILTVSDAQGSPIEGLTAENMRARLDGEEVAVTSISRGVDSNLPSFVVLAVDASDSMVGVPLQQAKLAAHQFVDGLASQDSVAILAFSDAASLIQTFTQDRAAAHLAIDSIVAGGESGLYEAATQGVLLGAASAQSGRRALVLLSSSADTTGANSAQSLVAAQGLGVPVFAIGLGAAADSAYLQQLTAAGGGRYAEAPTAEALPGVYTAIGDLLRNQYVVVMDASKLDLVTSEPATLRIELTQGAATGAAERAICPSEVCAAFRELEPGIELTEARTVAVEVVSSLSIQAVSLLVDGKKVQTLTSPPFEFSLDPTAYELAERRLAIAVATSAGEVTVGEIALRLGMPGERTGGSNMTLLLIPIVSVVLLLGVFVMFRLRKRQRPAPLPGAPDPTPSEPVSIMIAKNRARPRGSKSGEVTEPPPMELEQALGYIHMTSGPLAGRKFAVGAKPISVGSGHRCHIQLPGELDGYDVPSEFARVWIRGDQLMVHEVRRLTAMGAVGGQWEILADADTFALGPCEFRFQLGESVAVETPEPPPNVLRDASWPRVEALEPTAPEPARVAGGPFSPITSAAAEETSESMPDIWRDKPERQDTDLDEDPQLERAAGT